MFRDEYSSELDYLYQLGAEVARLHPRVAPMLGRDADPGVARVFQNAAFLFARLRQRLDDDLPEVIHPVIENVFPALLRPLPCTTIVALEPDATVKEPVIADRGCLFASGDVDGAPCLFRSMEDVEVRPWDLQRVDVATEGREVRLLIVLREGGSVASLNEGARLRLFLAGAGALELRSALTRRLVDASVRPDGQAGAAVSLCRGGQPCARPVAPPRAVAGEPGPPALHALRAYFAWPAMSAFVDLTNIDRAVPILSVHGAFEVVLRLAEPLPKAMRLGPRDVKLHCVPAINVHRIAPMVFSLDGGRCPIDPPRPGMQVYDVRSVRLLREQQAARTASPYIAFSSGTATVDDEPPILFSVDRIPSVTGADPFVFVALESTADLGLFESAEVDFEVTDGVRPERLGVGEISERVAGSPSGLTFRNVLPVTRTAAPAFDGDRLWRWLQLLKATLPQLVIPHQLAASVALANHPAWAHWPDAKATVDSFQGIASVQLGRPSGRDDAAVEVLVDVEPSTFAGSGDLDVFGERIADLLASTLRPHESVALTLRDTSHEVLLRYASIAGTKEGL